MKLKGHNCEVTDIGIYASIPTDGKVLVEAVCVSKDKVLEHGEGRTFADALFDLATRLKEG